MVLAAIILSSVICGVQLIGAGLYLGEGNGLGFVGSLIFGAISGFITYTLFTFGG